MIHFIGNYQKELTQEGLVIYANDTSLPISGVKLDIPEREKTSPNQLQQNSLNQLIHIYLKVICFLPHQVWTIKNGQLNRNLVTLPVKQQVDTKFKLTLEKGEKSIALVAQKGLTQLKVKTLILKDFKYLVNTNPDPIQTPIKNKSMGQLDFIDQIYYINMRERPERKKHIISELIRLFLPKNQVTPITAVSLPSNPQIGCALSHMKALSDASTKEYESILIFEDDFTFRVNREIFDQRIQELSYFFPDWDVCLLSSVNYKGNKTRCPSLERVMKADTTAGYLVRKSAIPLLFNIFYQCTKPKPEFCANQSAIDVAWQVLQPKLNWYIFSPHLGYQTEKFASDIELFRCRQY